MNSKTAVVGFVILLVVVVVISLSGPVEKPAPTVQQPSQPSEQTGDPYAQCVDGALKEAENCLLSGGSDCKAKAERALDDCKKLQ